jgi:hypothetical protein
VPAVRRGSRLSGSSHRKILNSWSISESPGKRGFMLSISQKMQPMDQTSTGVLYVLEPALHRVSLGVA